MHVAWVSLKLYGADAYLRRFHRFWSYSSGIRHRLRSSLARRLCNYSRILVQYWLVIYAGHLKKLAQCVSMQVNLNVFIRFSSNPLPIGSNGSITIIVRIRTNISMATKVQFKSSGLKNEWKSCQITDHRKPRFRIKP
jgi:hypothetical protein